LYSSTEPFDKPIRDTATVLIDSYNALYDEVPITLDDVSPCKKCLGVTVMDAIKDMNSYYWFMDAVIDMELYSLNKSTDEYVNRLENVEREHQLDYDT